MKFYNREKELALFDSIKEQSYKQAKMTVLLGRRRIGKTSLLKKANESDNSTVYFFAARKNEVLLCEEFVELDRKSTRLNSSHVRISYAVFCLKKKTERQRVWDG